MRIRGKRYKKISKKKLKIYWIAILAVIAILIGCVLYDFKNVKEDELINDIAIDKSNIIIDNKTERMRELEKLQNENSDIVGWIEIENSNINYPVLQTTNNDYYMNHNYKKEISKEGSLFLDKDYDWNLPSTNILIYGHNNRGSTEMFASLMNYKDEQFYKEHDKIRFTTVEEDAEYEIIAVFLSRVYYKSEKDVFRYYYFINAENEEEFNEYVNESKKASLYNIDATAKYGDQLLTLSTCSYHTEDGRLAVVARKIVE